MKFRLDSLDMKILYALDQNARRPLAQIARKLGIGRNVALYRHNRLKEEGIIKGAFIEINTLAIGYHSFRLFLKTGNETEEMREKLESFLLADQNLTWFSKCLGPWDIDVVFTTRKIDRFQSFKERLFLEFNSIIEDFEIALLVNIHSYDKEYLIGQKREQTFAKTLSYERRSLDEEDETLLRLLTRDAAIPIVDLAREAGLSINTVKRRMRDLEKRKVILKYRLFLDTNKIGYQYFKLHVSLRHYSEQDLKGLRAFIETKPYIPYTDHYINGEDFEIELHLPDEREYLEFLSEFRKGFGRIIKETYLIKFTEELLFRHLPEEE